MVKFIGTELVATLVDPDFQRLQPVAVELTGTLADGSTVSGE